MHAQTKDDCVVFASHTAAPVNKPAFMFHTHTILTVRSIASFCIVCVKRKMTAARDNYLKSLSPLDLNFQILHYLILISHRETERISKSNCDHQQKFIDLEFGLEFHTSITSTTSISPSRFTTLDTRHQSNLIIYLLNTVACTVTYIWVSLSLCVRDNNHFM